MRLLLLFAIASILAAPGWMIVKLQVVDFSAELCVGFRFLIAAIFVDIAGRLLKESRERLSAKVWGYIAVQGVFLYGINAWLYYYSSLYMVSGLIAVTISAVIIPNIFLGKWYVGIPIRLHTLVGGSIGIVGVMVLFGQELLSVSADYAILMGFLLAFGGNILMVIGTQASALSYKANAPIFSCTSKGLYIGGFVSLFASLLKDGFQEIPLDSGFWLSFLYLGIANSAVSFIVYSYTVKKHGPGIASYIWILTPASSLLLSAIYETYEWTLFSTCGVLLILLGSFIVAEFPFSKIWLSIKDSIYQRKSVFVHKLNSRV